MQILQSIIQSLSKEELRYFKIYISRLNYGEDRKDITLFEMFKEKAESLDEDEAARLLYGGKDKNAYYRLKNRLLQELNKSLVLQHIEEEDSKIQFFYALYKLFDTKKNKEAAAYYLKQMEKIATEQKNYQWLDILYSEAINFSLKDTDINPLEYIKKRAANYEVLNRLREMDQVLAAISYQLKISQNYSRKKNDIFLLLEQMIKKYSDDSSLKKDAVFTIKLYRAVSLILMTKEDYEGLRNFTEKTYKDALKNNIFNKSNHDSKLQMLTFLVNALFKLKEYKLSLSYAEELRKAMMEYDKMLEKKYEFFYHNTLVINYSVIDIDKAISLLLDMKNNIKKNKMTFYDIFTFINLALCYYKKNRFDDAIKQLISMKTQDVFKNADEHLRLKIDIAEQIIRFEINDFDIIDYRVNQIRREFKKLLLQEEAQRENEMLKLIVGISKSPDYYSQKKWQQVAKNIMKIETDIEEFIDYNEWIQKKFKHT
ncbi:MAG: hypothetical protein WCP57_12900 [Bacteroidota bacterium]